MQVKMGTRELTYPDGELGELRDSTDLLGDTRALHERMAEDGYLLLRGLIDRNTVLNARRAILEHMARQQALVPGRPVLEGAMPRDGKGVGMMGRKGITHHPDVLRVFEGTDLSGFFNRYFGEPPHTFDYKWLRAIGNEGFTGAHYDVVYMGRGSDRLQTCWIPFGDIPIEQGTLAMVPGSNRLESFEKLRQTYGQMDVDRDLIEGWFTDDPLEITDKFGGRWLTTDFRAGDVMVFGMHTLHASTTNTTDRFRLSADVRFQPASDPVDDRWEGDNPRGHDAWADGARIAMTEARAAWGV